MRRVVPWECLDVLSLNMSISEKLRHITDTSWHKKNDKKKEESFWKISKNYKNKIK